MGDGHRLTSGFDMPLTILADRVGRPGESMMERRALGARGMMMRTRMMMRTLRGRGIGTAEGDVAAVAVGPS